MKCTKIIMIFVIFIISITIVDINEIKAAQIEPIDSVKVALDDIILSGKDFLALGGDGSDIIDNDQIKVVTDNIYNVLLGIFMFLAVIVGIMLGIKYMLSGNDEKANVKQTLIPYSIAVFIMFSAFTIWKLTIILFE